MPFPDPRIPGGLKGRENGAQGKPSSESGRAQPWDGDAEFSRALQGRENGPGHGGDVRLFSHPFRAPGVSCAIVPGLRPPGRPCLGLCCLDLSGPRSQSRRGRAGELFAFAALVLCLLSFALTGCGQRKQEELKSVSFEHGLEKVYERGPLKVVMRLDKPTPTIAERVTLQLEVTASEEYEVTPPKFGEKLEQFGIADFSETQPELVEEGKTRQSRTYILEPFLSGEYLIPAMTYRFKKRDGSEDKEHELQTEELTVKVSSLLAEDAAKLEIHEIAPPVELAKPAPGWLWPLVAGIGAVAVAVVIMILLARRKSKEAVVARIPPHEVAFAELERLVAENLPEKGELKTFYQRVSDILRHYIENRFGLRAPERTTEEFLNELKSGEALDANHKSLLGGFLKHCDLVKFAELQPTHDDIQSTFDSCKNFILETKESMAVPAAS